MLEERMYPCIVNYWYDLVSLIWCEDMLIHTIQTKVSNCHPHYLDPNRQKHWLVGVFDKLIEIFAK